MQVSSDPLYDEEIDVENERIKRQKEQGNFYKTLVVLERSGRKSDAILHCPMCFTEVCDDCQQFVYFYSRHVKFKNQYRAMFVESCTIVYDQILRLDQEQFHPVSCSNCSTEIGVYDQEQVYHFFNVMSE